MKKLKLTTLVTALIINSVALADLNTGLVAHWSFDDCTATDISGNGHDGIINGNPQCETSIKGKAFNFNTVGASDYIDLGTSIPGFNNFTIAGWINISRLPEYVGNNRTGIIFSRGAVSTDSLISYNLYLQGAYSPSFLRSDIGIGADFGGYDGVDASALPPPKINTWIFVVSTYDGKQLSLFQDSKLISSTKTSRIPQAGNLQSSIGKSLNETYWNYDDSYGFSGLIDELRVYNRALTDLEITELYKQWNSSKPVLKQSWQIPAVHHCSDDRVNTTKRGLTSKTCFNNIKGATIKVFEIGEKTRMNILVNPTNQSGGFFFKMTYPSALQVSGFKIINSEPIPVQESGEVAKVLSLVADEAIDKALGSFNLPFKLIKILYPINSIVEPSFLELLPPDSLLSKELYPYQTIERHFQRPGPGAAITIQIDSYVPFTQFKKVMDLQKMSFYIGSDINNELLVEKLRSK